MTCTTGIPGAAAIGSTFKAATDAAKNLTIFKDLTTELNTAAGGISAAVSSQLASIQADIATSMNTFSQDFSIAKASMETKARELISDNVSPTIDQVKSTAEDMFKVLKDAPSLVQEKMAAITSTITSQAVALGLPANATVGEIKTKIAEYVDVNGNPVPPYDITPIPTGIQTAITNIRDGVNTSMLSLSNGVTGLMSAANAAKNEAISSLKANALVMQMYANANSVMTDIKNAVIQPGVVDTLNIRKVTGVIGYCDPSIPPTDPIADGPPVENNILHAETPLVSTGGADLITSTDVRTYYTAVVLPVKGTMEAARATLEQDPTYQAYIPIKTSHMALLSQKPESGDWSPAEQDQHTQYLANKQAVAATTVYQQYATAANVYNNELSRYKQYMVEGFVNNKPRAALPSDMRTVIG